MENVLDREYGFGSLLRFALPTIAMMVFLSLYTIVDGIFVSRFVGPDALSGLNIAWPLLNVVLGLGIMLATGGSALVARQMGEGREEAACRNFSLIVLTGVIVGLLLALVGIFFSQPCSLALGATPILLPYCRDYMLWMLLSAPFTILQALFQSFFVTAGRPGLGLGMTVCSGLTNGVLDYVFIVPLGLGVTGAALATGAGCLVTSAAGLIFFWTRREGLRFTRPKWDGKALLQVCGNGSSEMVSNLANGVVTYLFNLLMLHYLGEEGVAAITIILYTQFLLAALFLGFSMGVAPVISFNYGAQEHRRLRKVFRICLGFTLGAAAAVFLLARGLDWLLVGLFAPAGTGLYVTALDGFGKFTLCIPFVGLNILASALFTALSDGLTSAVISFARTFGFLLLGLLLLPLILEVDGVWLAVPFAEGLSALLSAAFLAAKRRKYHYGGPLP